MKCLNKKVVQKKRAIRLETEKIQEETRWNSLTPEEQKKELAEREAKIQTGMRALKNLQKIKAYIGGPY